MFFVDGLLYAIKEAKNPRRDSTSHRYQYLYALHGEVVILSQIEDMGEKRKAHAKLSKPARFSSIDVQKSLR